MSRGKVDLTPDDIIATLKNSSLPTIVAEGNDDIVILRRLEDRFANDYVSVFPVGGQGKVLSTFDRRKELPSDATIVFVADRDQWVFGAVPEEYVDDSLVFTDGYSIENDALRDINPLTLMSAAERLRFNDELNSTLRWFSTAMSGFLAGGSRELKTHPETLFSIPAHFENAEIELEESEAARDLLTRLAADPFKTLRGKTLLAVIMRQLSYAGRVARHHHLALLEASGANPGVYISKLFEGIAAALEKQHPERPLVAIDQ